MLAVFACQATWDPTSSVPSLQVPPSGTYIRPTVNSPRELGILLGQADFYLDYAELAHIYGSVCQHWRNVLCQLHRDVLSSHHRLSRYRQSGISLPIILLGREDNIYPFDPQATDLM